MSRTLSFFLMFLVACGLLAACNTDDPAQRPPATTGLVSGELDPAAGAFEIVLATAGTPEHPLQGPFVLRGANLRWVPDRSVLAVDLTITNAGEVGHAMPVGLTFVQLLPDTVWVLDADNGVEGPGAAIVFDFANDDLEWSPGETSFPRTVHFGVSPGTAIAFVARVDIGSGPLSGVIGGRVWHDGDRDGEQGEGEFGLYAQVILQRNTVGNGLPDPEPDYAPELFPPRSRVEFGLLRE